MLDLRLVVAVAGRRVATVVVEELSHRLDGGLVLEPEVLQPPVHVVWVVPVELEDAARIMVDNKIGGLPVMRGETLVGIITETDLFKIFIELFGAREKGVRMTVLIPAVKGELAKLTGAIAERGGNIIAFGTFLGDDASNAVCTLKVDDMAAKELESALKPLVLKVIDLREV